MYIFKEGQKRKLKGYLQRTKRTDLLVRFHALPWWSLFKQYYLACYFGQIKDSEFSNDFSVDGQLGSIEGFDFDTLTSELRVSSFIGAIRAFQAEVVDMPASPSGDVSAESGVQPVQGDCSKNADDLGLAVEKPIRVKRISQRKELVSIKVEPDLWERIKEQAEKEERSASALIRYAVKKYLESS